MFAGTILLIEAMALCLVCIALPRLYREVKRVLDGVPTGMGKFAGSLIPGFEAGHRFVKIAPRVVPIVAAVAGVVGLLGIYALLFSSPRWLNALAAFSLLPFFLLARLLFRLAKRHAPALKELLRAKNALR